MPEDAGVNGLAPRARVREMQTKLHRWAAADPGRRFDDLYNLVCDPAFLQIAWERVAGNSGARTAGVDRYTVHTVTEQVGVKVFLQDLRHQLRQRTFRPFAGAGAEDPQIRWEATQAGHPHGCVIARPRPVPLRIC